MTRCSDSYRPSQHSGRARYRFAGRVMRCVLEEGHEGAHVHEPCAAEPAPQYEPRPIAKPAPVERVDLGALFRENLRRRTFGR